MTLGTLKVRAAKADDAEAVGELARQFAAYLRRLGDATDFQFNAETYLRDGYGQNPAFMGLIAEIEGRVAGYLLYHFGYDVDRAMRLLYVIDLYVREDMRNRGAGKALMLKAADICRRARGRELQWAVFIPNTIAARFYERLGAQYTKNLTYMYLPLLDADCKCGE